MTIVEEIQEEMVRKRGGVFVNRKVFVNRDDEYNIGFNRGYETGYIAGLMWTLDHIATAEHVDLRGLMW